ncbi:hypothetical protein HU200_032827 [Digitaria exilis]|uniref:Uncharacterized protein n=1 Tax=Digitaria exilis TaxID=1010633 RepID=A0A835ERT8_9POAL|nr:hypothetical protein HU200_032827 [Digitaria exilis]
MERGLRATAASAMEMTKQHKDDEAMTTKKPKGDEEIEMLLVDARSSDEQCGKGRRKAKRVTWRSPLHMEETTTEEPNGVDEAMKPKDDEAETLVVDAGSKETGGGKRRKTKLVTLGSPFTEDILISQLMEYMLHWPPRHTSSECDFANVPRIDPDSDAQIFALFKEESERRANVLQQYRTNGYAEFQLEVEVTDDDEEELTYEPGGGAHL